MEPPHPLEGCELHVLYVPPRASPADDLGIEEADHRFGQSVVVGGFPKAKISHFLWETDLPEGKVVLHLDAKIENLGDTLLRVGKIDARIQQVSPLSDSQLGEALEGTHPLDPGARTSILWPLIARRESDGEASHCQVEPGESEVLHFDFVLGTREPLPRAFRDLGLFDQGADDCRTCSVKWSDLLPHGTA